MFFFRMKDRSLSSVTAFLPRSNRLLISWLESPSAVILEPKKIKPVTVSIVSHLFAMKWWDWMPWSSFFEFWVSSQLFPWWVGRGYIVAAAVAMSLQLCLTLCNPIDSSPPGSSLLGILQARTLEWVAISFSNAWKWSRSVVSDS